MIKEYFSFLAFCISISFLFELIVRFFNVALHIGGDYSPCACNGSLCNKLRTYVTCDTVDAPLQLVKALRVIILYFTTVLGEYLFLDGKARFLNIILVITIEILFSKAINSGLCTRLFRIILVPLYFLYIITAFILNQPKRIFVFLKRKLRCE